MSKISTLQELYVDELKDLWSSNDQMMQALSKITPYATHSKLVSMLETSKKGIAKHTELLKTLIEAQGEKVKKEHCKGMEGLVAEAIKHTIAQYQRMTHYGVTGFGTVSAFAKALQLHTDHQQLGAAVKDMYQSDELMTELAESAVNTEAV